jgi:hypothetical protein
MTCAAAHGASVNLYVDAAPNVYGSPDYEPWKAQAFAKAADGTFVNMANSVDPANVGTTNFHLQDEVVYSFGDLGKRLTWIYWVPGETISTLEGNFRISLENVWDGDYLDFYDYYYDETWLEPTKWIDYDADGDGDTDGVIGTAGMAWWGAYEVNTQEALDQDLLAWRGVDETWTFTVRLTEDTQQQDFSIVSSRAAVPEPLTMLAVGSAVAGLGGYIRRRRRA